MSRNPSILASLERERMVNPRCPHCLGDPEKCDDNTIWCYPTPLEWTEPKAVQPVDYEKLVEAVEPHEPRYSVGYHKTRRCWYITWRGRTRFLKGQ